MSTVIEDTFIRRNDASEGRVIQAPLNPVTTGANTSRASLVAVQVTRLCLTLCDPNLI